jgi:hypothetical protein
LTHGRELNRFRTQTKTSLEVVVCDSVFEKERYTVV